VRTLPGDVARALVECVRHSWNPQGTPGAAAAPARLRSLDGLATASAAHGVSGFAWRAVRDAGLGDRPDAEPLRAAAAVAAGRHLRALAETERIDAALAAVPWLLFKGPVLALVHGSPALRSPVDLDILVPRCSFGAAVAALERAGYVVYERNWTLVRNARLGSLRLHSPAGALVDLHWDLLNARAERDAFTVSSESVMARARRVSLGPLTVRTLDPVDTVVHLALHAAMAGAHRLVWLADVAAAVRAIATPAGATGVAARAVEWSVVPPVGLVLRRCLAVLGADSLGDGVEPVPLGVLWGAVCRLADVVTPVSSRSGGPSLAAAVARSARADGAASLRELRRHLTAAAGSGGARPDPQALFDPSDPASVAYPAGGPEERGAYLGEVTA
jgi:hypothetical protein